MKIFSAIVILCLACTVGRAAGAGAATQLNVIVQPEHVLIGAAYNGENISVAGKIPSDASALIRVTGNPEHSKLKQKGRALGVLWMNLDSVEISKVPDVFLLYLPERAPNELPIPDLGLQAVRKQAEIVSRDENKNALFDEFVKLKQKSGLYGTLDNAIHYAQDNDNSDMKSFSAILALPAALPQGTYKIEVFAIKNGAITATAVREIDAREVGMPALISSLAFEHGTVYGILAVLVAVIAGLLTGVMFKGEKGSH